MNNTESTLVLLWKVASHTVEGYSKLQSTITDMSRHDEYDNEMLKDAHELAFNQRQALQLQENTQEWVG